MYSITDDCTTSQEPKRHKCLGRVCNEPVCWALVIQEKMQNIPDNKRLECANYALHGYGTGYIFEKRAASIQSKIKWLSFLGVAVPASVGAAVGSYKLSSDQLGVLLFVASSIAFFQLILSIWSLSSGWGAQLSDYLNLKEKNYGTADKYEKLGKDVTKSLKAFQSELDKLDIERNFIKQATNQHSISEKEKRKGMRYSLRKYRRECAGCGEVPNDMKNSKCGVCGQFRIFN